MCGRYLLLSPAEAMRRLFGLSGLLPNFPARFNVAPTDIMPVVRAAAGEERELALLRWGLVPPWAPDLAAGSRMINARGESVATKPAFREAFAQRRCLVPADGYYEWKNVDGKRQAYAIRPADAGLIAFAGIWESWKRPKDVDTGSPRDIGPAGEIVETFSIVTGAALPSVDWQPSDIDPDNLASQRAWVDEAGLPNVRPPRPIDVTDGDWDLGDPAGLCAVVCCNMIHSSPWACAEGLFAGVGRLLPPGGALFLYGPFRFHGAFTAPSNAAFDESLRARDPRWGVRDVDDLTPLAAAAGLALEEVVALPANNHTLCFRRL